MQSMGWSRSPSSFARSPASNAFHHAAGHLLSPIVFHTDSGKLTDSKYSKAIKSSVSNLKKTPHVTAAISPLSNAGSSALSKNKQIGYITVALNVGQGSIDDDEAQAVLTRLQRKHPPQSSGSGG